MVHYRELIDIGQWLPENYPPPPWHYPSGIEDSSGLPRLTECLVKRGYSNEDVRGILGENLMRVYGEALEAGAGVVARLLHFTHFSSSSTRE